MTSWSSDRTLHKVIWGIYALLWDFYQVPKLSCFCELSTSSRFFCTKLKLHVEDDLEIKKKLQGSNQMHKWSLHAKIWVLEMNCQLSPFFIDGFPNYRLQTSIVDVYALTCLQSKLKIFHGSISCRYHLYLLTL